MATAHQAEYPGDSSGKGTLYVVATPIGNLGDITFRALDTLRAVDLVAAEDTRVTGKLLGHFGLTKPMLSVREHNEKAGAQKVVETLARGESVALVTDAGTPAVSDPGGHVVAAARQAGFPVVPIPGPSALVAALSASGVSAPHFLYYGFLPAKGGERRNALAALKDLPYALVFYESPHRIAEALADLSATLGEARTVVIARELTKLFEQIHACALGEALVWLNADANRQKGEFVLIVSGAEAAAEDDAEARRVLEILLQELPVSQAAKLAAEISGGKKKALYELALRLKDGA